MYGIYKYKLQLLLVAFASLVEAQNEVCFNEPPGSSYQEKISVPEADRFGIDLFRRLAIAIPANSLFMSPYSVWSVLGIAYLGAEGDTQKQLESALHLGPTKSRSFINRGWLNFMLKFDQGNTLLKRADKAYFSDKLPLRECMSEVLTDVEIVNFRDTAAAAAKINYDVSNATEGKINNFLSPNALANAEFVLINAVYFKGTWANKFNESRTEERNFTDELGSTVLGTVSMMNLTTKFKYYNSPSLGSAVLELPYDSSMVSMYLILPEFQTSTETVLRNLDYDVLEEVFTKLVPTQVELGLPKFKLTSRLSTQLKKALASMGIIDLFVPGKANLSTFVTSTPLNVDAVLHQSTVEITEEGTVAAAVTALIGTRSGTSSRPVKFICDRPFIFILREKRTKITLFAGIYRNPNDAEAIL